MKLTNAQVLELSTAFSSIPLKGDAVINAAENIAILEPIRQSFGVAQSSVVKQFSGAVRGTKKFAQFEEANGKLLAKLVDVPELCKIKKASIDTERQCDAIHIAILKVRGLLEG
jgi:hypothetical protein